MYLLYEVIEVKGYTGFGVTKGVAVAIDDTHQCQAQAEGLPNNPCHCYGLTVGDWSAICECSR